MECQLCKDGCAVEDRDDILCGRCSNSTISFQINISRDEDGWFADFGGGHSLGATSLARLMAKLRTYYGGTQQTLKPSQARQLIRSLLYKSLLPDEIKAVFKEIEELSYTGGYAGEMATYVTAMMFQAFAIGRSFERVQGHKFHI